MAYAATKEHAHELIDRIDQDQVPVVVELLEKMLDPASLAQANAPFEDEAVSDDENRVAAEARARGYVASPTSHVEFLKEFGLTPEDFKRMGREPLETDVSH